MKALTIGVDATCWANARGYGRFTREICSAMVREGAQHRFVFFADARAAECFKLREPNVRLVTVEQRVSPTQAAAADGNRSPVDMLRFTRAVGKEELDVFFCPSIYTYFPLPPRLRAVVTIHDAIAERYPHLTLPTRRSRWFWRAKVRLAIAQSRLVLTVSEFSARELSSVLGLAPARLRVALEAPPREYRPSRDPSESTAAARRAGVPDGARWFIYVGGFNPHKHVDLAVRAHAELCKVAANPPHLLLVGTIDADVFHGDQALIRATIAECKSESLVHWTGFVADEELCRLHSGAIALLLPSECEGFGLPAIEAAACGTPVIATSNSPLPELLEGGGIFVAPGDVDALEAAMTLLASEEPARLAMGVRALECARALTWPAGARAALSALEEAAA